MGIFDWLKKKEQPSSLITPLRTDMHSHLIPGIDDGVETINDAIEVIGCLKNLGYDRLITTPHIMGDFYKNDQQNITAGADALRAALKEKNIDIVIEAAAEYYLDEWFQDKLSRPEELLYLGDKYLLVETSYINEPSALHETLFQIQAMGFKPILAHPERYLYMHADLRKYEALYEKGVFFQINLNSLTGYYSKAAKHIAEHLISKGMVHFAGTDCHGMRHIDALKKAIHCTSYKKLLSLDLMNNHI